MSTLCKINTCDISDFLKLPGVGVKIANRIFKLRKVNTNLNDDDIRSLPHLKNKEDVISQIDFEEYDGYSDCPRKQEEEADSSDNDSDVKQNLKQQEESFKLQLVQQKEQQELRERQLLQEQSIKQEHILDQYKEQTDKMQRQLEFQQSEQDRINRKRLRDEQKLVDRENAILSKEKDMEQKLQHAQLLSGLENATSKLKEPPTERKPIFAGRNENGVGARSMPGPPQTSPANKSDSENQNTLGVRSKLGTLQNTYIDKSDLEQYDLPRPHFISKHLSSDTDGARSMLGSRHNITHKSSDEEETKLLIKQLLRKTRKHDTKVSDKDHRSHQDDRQTGKTRSRQVIDSSSQLSYGSDRDRPNQKGDIERLNRFRNDSEINQDYQRPQAFNEARRHHRRNHDDTDSDDDYGYGRHNRLRRFPLNRRNTQTRNNAFSLPKTFKYDGRGSWQAFLIKFKSYAKMSEWTPEEKLNQLCWCLEGKASEYYALMIERNANISFRDMIAKFDKRFGFKELPETAQVQFNNLRQNAEESLEEWADRVLLLATTAFKELSDEHMYKQAVLKFCQGCYDKEASQYVSNQRPNSIENALDLVRWFQHTHQAIYGRTKVRSVTFESENTNTDYSSVNSVNTNLNMPKESDTNLRISRLEKKMSKQSDDLLSLRTEMTSGFNLLKEEFEKLTTSWKPRSRTPSPAYKRNSSSSPPIVARVTVMNRVVIPPNSAARIGCELSKRLPTYVVEPLSNVQGLIPCTLHDTGTNPTVCVLNISNENLVLRKNETVTKAVVLDEIDASTLLNSPQDLITNASSRPSGAVESEVTVENTSTSLKSSQDSITNASPQPSEVVESEVLEDVSTSLNSSQDSITNASSRPSDTLESEVLEDASTKLNSSLDSIANASSRPSDAVVNEVLVTGASLRPSDAVVNEVIVKMGTSAQTSKSPIIDQASSFLEMSSSIANMPQHLLELHDRSSTDSGMQTDTAYTSALCSENSSLEYENQTDSNSAIQSEIDIESLSQNTDCDKQASPIEDIKNVPYTERIIRIHGENPQNSLSESAVDQSNQRTFTGDQSCILDDQSSMDQFDSAKSSLKYKNDQGAQPYLFPEVEFQNAAEILTQQELGHIVEEWFLECMQIKLRREIGPEFWKLFQELPENAPENHLFKAVDYLHKMTSDYVPCIQRLDSLISIHKWKRSVVIPNTNKLSDSMILLVKAVVFSLIPSNFQDVVDKFYSRAFKVFHHSSSDVEQDKEEEEECTTCKGCSEDIEACHCQQIMEKFHEFNRKLDDIGILERVSGTSVTSIVHERIKCHVEHTCKGNFEISYLETFENWLETKVLGWLHLVYTENRTHIYPECIAGFKGRLLHFMYETFAKTQIDQLFNIIIEFPESEPAILDLKVCLEKTDLRTHLVASLKSALETRLLHPGVNTSDILTAYIAAIRALRVLDPAGVILELVCDPVRKYLRSRDDTVRCIVSNLTDDGSIELLDELVKGQPLVLDEGSHSDDEDEDWEKWMPDPVDADPSTTSKSRRASDIISMLVNIYGSKELFVNEYRTLLADRILTHFNYDIVKEIRYLELLKLRFGESQLHYCEVMLKDVADSKRLNSRVIEERNKTGIREEIECNAMVLSAQFWPAFREEKITLPEIMQNSLVEYTKKFETLKGNRTLNWKPHLGLVNIDVELKDRTLNFNVSPVHAAIIMQFENQDKWSVDDLSNVLQMPASALRRKIAYWQTQGLLKEETTDIFVLVEEHKGRTHDVIITDDDETESAMASAHAQREEELQVFWSYIVGMLTNLESLPIERIHSMLRMFAVQGPSSVECSIPELKAFLDRKVKEQKLFYFSGVYRLPKPN